MVFVVLADCAVFPADLSILFGIRYTVFVWVKHAQQNVRLWIICFFNRVSRFSSPGSSFFLLVVLPGTEYPVSTKEDIYPGKLVTALEKYQDQEGEGHCKDHSGNAKKPAPEDNR